MPTLTGTLRVPGDKSISHRALIFSALAQGECLIKGISPAEDCRSTASCLSQLGVLSQPSHQVDTVRVLSPGLPGLVQPSGRLNAGNSGTTMRLLAGLLSGQPFTSTLDGDISLRRRPMSRIVDPLKLMGSKIYYEEQEGCAPFTVGGGRLSGISFCTTLASAQVQTGLLLAGLQAQGETSIRLPAYIRDHTLRLFEHIGVPFTKSASGTLRVQQLKQPVRPFSLSIPADISSAAFFMVGAACLPGSDILLPEVGLNPGRRLVIDVLLAMGADLQINNQRLLDGEPVADIRVRYRGRLQGITIDGATIASGIDEIPILALAGSLCQGTFLVRGAAELRHKESDRLSAIISNYQNAGTRVQKTTDGFSIQGQPQLPGGCNWHALGDHRLAMAGLVADLVCLQRLTIDNIQCVSVSYPSFQSDLWQLLKG